MNSVNLSFLINGLKVLEKRGNEDPVITGLSYDSREVTPGDLYFAFDGVHTDGHLYIDDALKKGACAVVHSRQIDNYKNGISYIMVDKTRPALSAVAARFYGNPSKKLLQYGLYISF